MPQREITKQTGEVDATTAIFFLSLFYKNSQESYAR